MKKATTLEQQIEIFKGRGMIFDDENKSKEVLLDIGYYRLGFYGFPFEKSFPKLKNRTHEYVAGTRFNDVVELYYLDSDLRQILMKYLNRIEINIRTYLTYTVSNCYPELPTWFVSREVVSQAYIKAFEKSVYNNMSIKDNPIIKAHHEKYPKDKFAPAWKTIEFMTLGNICYLYANLKDQQLTRDIAYHYGCGNRKRFISYLNAIRIIRNTCAHGGCLYDIKLNKPILSGPAKTFISSNDASNINAAIQVIRHILRRVSNNRMLELDRDIEDLLSVNRSPNVAKIIEKCTGIERKCEKSLKKTEKKLSL